MMLNHNDTVDAMQYAFRFGEVAIRLGFISIHQLRDALEEQISSESYMKLRPRKRIGEIFLEKGIMTPNQVEMVLEEMSFNQRRAS
jgi:hypothetical protein